MWELTVKECFDQDCFADDKIKWYDASVTDADLHEALIRRFKSRFSILKKNWEAFMKVVFFFSRHFLYLNMILTIPILV